MICRCVKILNQVVLSKNHIKHWIYFMVKGFDQAKRNLNVSLHKLLSNIAGNISDSINTSEPSLNVKVEKRSEDGTNLRAVIKGSAELPKVKEDKIDQIVSDAIKNNLG